MSSLQHRFKTQLVALWQKAAQRFAALRMIPVMLLVALLLSGCVESEVAIQFDSSNRGEIVQHIDLGDRIQRLNTASIQSWVKTIEHQAAKVGGRVQRSPDAGITVTIPFTSSDELAKKFNSFFGSTLGVGLPGTDGIDLPPIASHLQVRHNNFLVVERHQLRYEVDLRSLGISSSQGNVLVSPLSLIQLGFQVQAPWGVRSPASDTAIAPISSNNQTPLWKLIPGEQNTLEAIFWLPNPLGIGTIAIALLVGLGWFLKYAHPPAAIPPPTQAPLS